MGLREIDLVLAATSASILFGSTEEKTAKKEYKRLVREVHPDTLSEGDLNKSRAEEAFNRLTLLWDSIKSNKASTSSIVRTRKHEYVLGGLLSEDDVVVRLMATYDAGHEACTLVVAKSVHDADLVSAYATSVRKLREVPESYRMYFPEFVETFRYRQDDGDHSALTVKSLKGFYTLRQVKERYPDGIGGRDIAWIFRRMLVALGNAHDLGLVHGAPSLDAFYIHPEMHGLVLDDWHYSVSSGSPLVAVPAATKNLYPANALSKEPVDYRLDILIASRIANELLSHAEPSALRAFFKGCQVSSPPRAAHLLTEFDDLLERLYGKRTFHPFTMSN